METSTILLGLAVLGVGALAMAKKSKVERKGKPGAKDDHGNPIVPKVTPDEHETLSITSDMVSAPGLWGTEGMKGTLRGKGKSEAEVANLLVYVGVFADQVFLNPPDIKADQDALADWLEENGFSHAHEILNNRRNGEVVGTWDVHFDSNLTAEVRSWVFYLIATQRSDDLKAEIASEAFAKYPKFKASVEYLLTHGLKKKSSPVDQSSGIDLDRPETWGLANADGPVTVETPKGKLFVPKGGQIRGGAPQYVVQSGDYSGHVIAQHWGKEDQGWANWIAHENPSEHFGGSNNTIFPGKVLHMPWKFLDPSDNNPPPPVGNSQPSNPYANQQVGPKVDLGDGGEHGGEEENPDDA